MEHWGMLSNLYKHSDPRKQMNAIVFLGGPGSGKGTQANLLAQQASFVHLDFGQTVRNALRQRTTVGQRILASGQYGPGKFLGQQLVLEVMEEAAARLCASVGTVSWAILDGCPRSVEQAKHMHSIGLDVRLAVYLHAPEDVLFHRVDGRLIHPESGRTYHRELRPPARDMKDDITGEPLEVRRLDKLRPNREVFKSRMDVEFNQHVVPLIEWYRGGDAFMQIDATDPVEAIHEVVCGALRSLKG